MQSIRRRRNPQLLCGSPPARSNTTKKGLPFPWQERHQKRALRRNASTCRTHSMRRTKVVKIHQKTSNLRAVQPLLGHTKCDSSIRYLASNSRMPLQLRNPRKSGQTGRLQAAQTCRSHLPLSPRCGFTEVVVHAKRSVAERRSNGTRKMRTFLLTRDGYQKTFQPVSEQLGSVCNKRVYMCENAFGHLAAISPIGVMLIRWFRGMGVTIVLS